MAPGIFGRDQELASVAAFVDRVPKGPVAFVIEGEAGIGKTTLWRRASDEAASRSYSVLTSRPGQSETKLSFAALSDLLGALPGEVFARLPQPQREAVEVTLQRTSPRAHASDQRALSMAVLSLLTELAESAPVLVAVDDAQWLDRPSARVLEFVFRRLQSQPVGIVVSVRSTGDPDVPLGLDRALPPERIVRLAVGPLGLGALHHLITEREGHLFPRSVLVRIADQSGGNPFFALEIARALSRKDSRPSPGQPLPVPSSLTEILLDRVAALPATTRRALLVASMLSEPSAHLVRTVATEGSRQRSDPLASAEESGVIEISDGLMSFTHPLFASAVYGSASGEQRRRLHRRLAALAVDAEERARHLGLATEEPDPQVASALDEGARRAWARGAPDAAAELAELARRLTPAGRPAELRARAIDAASYHLDAGDSGRARTLLEEAVGSSPPGQARADALIRLAWTRYYADDSSSAAELFRAALAEATTDAGLVAAAREGLAWTAYMLGDTHSAVAHARAMIEAAERARNPAMLAEGLLALGFQGGSIGDPEAGPALERATALQPYTEHLHLVARPAWALAVHRIHEDDLDAARRLLEPLRREAVERGDEASLPLFLMHLSQVELLAGNWDVAERYATREHEVARQTGQLRWEAYALCRRASVDAHLGRVDAVRRRCEEGLALADRAGVADAKVLLLASLGFLELSLGNHATAHRHLGEGFLAERLERLGMGEPAAQTHVPDEVEALLGLGELDRATELLGQYEGRARERQRTSALAAAERCRGLLLAARGDWAGASDHLAQAVEWQESLGQPFGLGRALLAMGQVQRRAGRKRHARESLERSIVIFEGLGAALWLAKARAELGRIGGRSAARWELTESERRVAELAAGGARNKDIAAALYLSPRTVELHLTKVYRKLGIRSRTELAGRIAQERSPETTT